MPKNQNLKPVELPMKIRFNEEPKTNFVNNLKSINVSLIQAPTMDALRTFLVPFLEATWSETPYDQYSMGLKEKDDIIRQCLEGKALPTALETVMLVWSIDGISLQEVTHILRHRMASFSADCSGDKWWSHKDALVPSSIEQSTGKAQRDSNDDFWEVSPYYDDSENGSQFIYKSELDFLSRYKCLVRDAKKLYCDMINTKKISIMDARYCLPRCLSTFYFMKMSLGDTLAFIRQRMDKQIQPETDNVIAYQMLAALLKIYPVLDGIIDIHSPSSFYVKMARSGKATNLYFPDDDSDKFEWNEFDFIYQARRDQMNGTDPDAVNKFTQEMLLMDAFIEEQSLKSQEHLANDYADEAFEKGGIDYGFEE